jgi:hypothetical protein
MRCAMRQCHPNDQRKGLGAVKLPKAALKLFDPAVLLPELHIETSDYLLSLFPRRFVIIADEINGFDEMTIPTKKVRSGSASCFIILAQRAHTPKRRSERHRFRPRALVTHSA